MPARPSRATPGRSPGPPLVALALAAGSLALYLPVAGFPFLGYDDGVVLLHNPHVREGLTADSVRWAFTTTALGNWIPLTWLSHLADVSLFGMSARAHHLGNAAVYALGAALLFLFLHRATGAAWRSAATAALFAAHPLHVESVAWVTLRRDVLMGALCFLALLAWDRRLRGGGARWYALALALFALGLMSKALLVAFPVLLLALDWWPYGRWRRGPAGGPGRMRLLAEKTPFLLLALGAAAIGFAAQRGAINSEGQVPLLYRAMNASVSSAWYLLKSLWPTGLAVFYPHPQAGVAVGATVAAGVSLAAATVAAVLLRRRLPWLAAGWLWFLAGLVPALGLAAQVGEQARADRYAYLPLLGVLWAAVWSAAALARRRPALGRLLPAAALVAVSAAAAASHQLGYWRDEITLFERAAAVTSGNYVAQTQLGRAHLDAGRLDLAARHLGEALRISPSYPPARNNLGVLALLEGRLGDAERELRAGIASYERFGYLHRNLGAVLARTGRPGEAVAELRRALALDPEDALALRELGVLRLQAGDRGEGISLLRRAVDLAPGDHLARFHLGTALSAAGRPAEAEAELRAAARLAPRDSATANNLGMVIARQGRLGEAREWFARALELDGGNATARENLERAGILAGDGADGAGEEP